MHDGEQQRLATALYRGGVDLHVPDVAIGKSVLKQEEVPFFGQRQLSFPGDGIGRKRVDFADGHLQQLGQVVAIVGDCRGVGVDDFSAGWLDEQHDREILLEEAAKTHFAVYQGLVLLTLLCEIVPGA